MCWSLNIHSFSRNNFGRCIVSKLCSWLLHKLRLGLDYNFLAVSHDHRNMLNLILNIITRSCSKRNQVKFTIRWLKLISFAKILFESYYLSTITISVISGQYLLEEEMQLTQYFLQKSLGKMTNIPKLYSRVLSLKCFEPIRWYRFGNLSNKWSSLHTTFSALS